MSNDETQKVEAEVVEEVGQMVATPPSAPEGTLADRDPGEVAAIMIKQFSPRFKQIVNTLDKVKARKLALALATYPLENETGLTVAMMDSQLKEAYALGDRLIQAKMLLINEILLTRINAQEEQKDEAQNG